MPLASSSAAILSLRSRALDPSSSAAAMSANRSAWARAALAAMRASRRSSERSSHPSGGPACSGPACGPPSGVASGVVSPAPPTGAAAAPPPARLDRSSSRSSDTSAATGPTPPGKGAPRFGQSITLPQPARENRTQAVALVRHPITSLPPKKPSHRCDGGNLVSGSDLCRQKSAYRFHAKIL